MSITKKHWKEVCDLIIEHRKMGHTVFFDDVKIIGVPVSLITKEPVIILVDPGEKYEIAGKIINRSDVVSKKGMIRCMTVIMSLSELINGDEMDSIE